MIVFDYEDKQVIQRTLSKESEDKVVGEISQKWLQWSSGIKTMKESRDRLVEESKPKVCKVNNKDDDDWHSKIELNRPYQYYSKLYGILYETFYDKIASYLRLSQQNFDAVYHRAFSVENKKEILVAANDMLEYGEVVASAELKNTYKKDVFPIEQITMFDEGDIISVKETSFTARVKTGEEINFVRINPCNFAYDPLIVPGTKDFDECDKIVKQWKTKQEILNNKNYEITKDELDNIIGNYSSPNMRSKDEWDKDVVYRYNQVEVLTYYGDFYIDGKYYNDYVAVVVARNKLVYFKPRDIYTPGIYYYPYHAYGNGARGTSPLFYILDLCRLEQKTLNNSVDFLELQKNPPCYAPVGFFEESVTKLRPGQHITYRLGMQDPNAIIKMEFNAQPLMAYEAATAQLTEEIAGIDNGRLSEKSEALTQEEVRRVATSENLVPNMIISGIMLNVIAKYLTDCIKIVSGAEQQTTAMVKTAWEYANEQMQMQNVVQTLQQIGESDPTMVNLQAAARKVFDSMGVNPDEYLNDGRSQEILNNLMGMDDEVLQQVFGLAQQLQVQANNEKKAAKMLGNIQDDLFRKALRESWNETGMLPTTVAIPNGPDAVMDVPVVPVTPAAQTNNKAGTPV